MPSPLSSRLLKIAVLGLATIGPSFLGGCDRQSDPKAQPSAQAQPGATHAGALDRSHRGAALPAMDVRDPEGQTLALDSLKGRPVLLNLWATWCAPCITELPTLNALSNRADATVRVVTVSQDMGDPAKVRAFLDGRGFAQLPAWIDPQGDLAMQMGAQTLPTTILYDSGGREVWRYVGGRDWGDAESTKLLGEAS